VALVKHNRVWGAAAAGTVLAGGALFASAWAVGGEPEAGVDRTPDVVVAHGSDRLPNHSASDWVTYADHVVVVTATAEKELPANKDEVEMGSGYIPREVTLDVEDTVWSRPGTSKPVPEDGLAWPAAGWTFDEDGNAPMAMEGQPRIEVGHRYLMAIAWEPAATVDGTTYPGKWDGLGENAVLPYDGGVIGKGESEGAVVAKAKTEHTDEGAEGPSIEKELNGKSATDLAAALDAAKPTERKDYGPTTR
jgi:hypothetical protein